MGEPPQDLPEKLASFQDVTGMSDPQQCLQVLEAHSWDLDAAVGTILALSDRDNTEAGPSHQRPVGSSGAGPSSSSQWENQQALVPRNRSPYGSLEQPPGLLWRTVTLPSTIIRGGIGLAAGAVGLGLWAASGALGYGLSSLGSAANWALGMPSQDRVPQGLSEAARFMRSFEAEYGDVHPAFVDAPFMAAVRQAQQQFKFLFVYLHSPEHANTPDFCRGTLCSESFVQFVNDNFVSWGGDVRQSEGFQMSASLKASTYPFVAVVTATPGQVAQKAALLQQIEGPRSAEELIGLLQRVINEQGAVLAAAQAEEEERRMERMLREEQDAAYQASLLEDQERERKAVEEAAKAAAEAAVLAEQQRALEEAAARVKREAEEREAMLERRRNEKASALGPEPAKAPDVTQVLVRLPNGDRRERRFMSSDTVQSVYDFVDSLESMSHVHYSLVMSFPRKVFGPATRSLTLMEAGLHPHASVFVQEEDS